MATVARSFPVAGCLQEAAGRRLTSGGRTAHPPQGDPPGVSRSRHPFEASGPLSRGAISSQGSVTAQLSSKGPSAESQACQQLPTQREKITHPCQSLVLVPGPPADRLVGAHSAPTALLFPLMAHACVCACVIAHLCTQICDLHIPVIMHFLPPIEGPVQILIKAGSPPARPPRQEFLFLLNFVFRWDPRIHFNFKPTSLRSHKEGLEQSLSMG